VISEVKVAAQKVCRSASSCGTAVGRHVTVEGNYCMGGV